jgi:nucleotide-binding universal stress UspA family protein
VTGEHAGYQRLLVPVDFSPAAAHALRYALALGARFESTVDALHVWRTNTETQVSAARERAKKRAPRLHERHRPARQCQPAAAH